jgi:hypothetical protein
MKPLYPRLPTRPRSRRRVAASCAVMAIAIVVMASSAAQRVYAQGACASLNSVIGAIGAPAGTTTDAAGNLVIAQPGDPNGLIMPPPAPPGDSNTDLISTPPVPPATVSTAGDTAVAGVVMPQTDPAVVDYYTALDTASPVTALPLTATPATAPPATTTPLLPIPPAGGG